MTWRIYLFNVILAFDQLCNCIVRGRPGMTLSARADTARRDNRWWGCQLCRWLDRIEKDHCANAVKNDIARAGAVVLDCDPKRGEPPTTRYEG